MNVLCMISSRVQVTLSFLHGIFRQEAVYYQTKSPDKGIKVYQKIIKKISSRLKRLFLYGQHMTISSCECFGMHEKKSLVLSPCMLRYSAVCFSVCLVNWIGLCLWEKVPAQEASQVSRVLTIFSLLCIWMVGKISEIIYKLL